MDSTDDLQPAPARRSRTSPVALAAAGSLAGLVLGFGGMALADTTPAPASTSSSVQQAASTDEDTADQGTADQDTADQDTAADDGTAGAAAREDCEEGAGANGTAPDSSAESETGTTSSGNV